MDIKDLFFNKIFSLRRLFVWGNVLLLVLTLVVIVKDHDRGWKPFQKEFKALEVERAKKLLSEAKTEDQKIVAERALSTAKRFKVEIRQIWNDEIGAVDRCISCHVGFDSLSNTSMTTEYWDHPFRAPANSPSFEIHKAHDVVKFGCVVCHDGQGLATEVKAAHGKIAHWEKPLLTGNMIQASCVKCHDNAHELEVMGKIYPSEVIRAKELFNELGCIGCHQIDGEGGPVSVDLMAETAAKPISRIDFAYTGLSHEDRTLENWIKLHFIKDPWTLVPGDPKGEFNDPPIAPSGMPAYHLSHRDAEGLTAYILGLNRKGIPNDYLVRRPPPEEPTFSDPVQRGRYVYEKLGCAGCHGSQGRGGIRNFNYQYDVTPNLRRAVSSYTRAELREKLNDGAPILAKHDPNGPQPPFYMPPWKDKVTSREMDDLISYLFSIKE